MNEKRIKIGMEAPKFVAQTWQGEEISSSQFLGSPLWLIFYRYPGCPLCNLHLNAVKKRCPDLMKRGLKIIAIFESSPDKFKSLKEPFPDFPLISEPEKKLYELYETEESLKAVLKPSVVVTFIKAILNGNPQGKIDGKIGQVPAHFLIAEDGIIQYFYYGKSIGDHISFTSVERFLDSRVKSTWNTSVRR